MALLHLLKGAESISSLRDRNTAAAMATTAIVHLLKPLSFCWLRPWNDGKTLSIVSRYGPHGLWLSNLDNPDSMEWMTLDELHARHPDTRDAIAARATVCKPAEGGGFQIALPFFTPAGHLDSILVATCESPIEKEQHDGIKCFLHFYANYLILLDYGEIDTLTGLHNRKTFDDSFERLVTNQPPPGPPSDRRQSGSDAPWWLAVIDLDHFKHINDTWGHLFGDETLLRFARLLKETFRTEDRLFRFGGEEFIIILRAANNDHAFQALERFRAKLARADFPHIDSLTCSIGYTHLDPRLASVDILGFADQALYYAKASGRNRTCGYESLVAEGLIVPHHTVEGGAAVDFDIDALFA